ncbi:4'-phosphopantetheinyl transferase family protein [Chryseosolibacter indicus]|uniref:4'-phosphopantetheinyl transferase superfamily protein n=1 Tax=Chryseosolibacter indicus TaxID=2782351 RepID=A0ABS5VSP2_9BACT|nr:4'-phosphopantetheinyl transferase superfamily protein [Chryseosolibacter indicus]MBT1704048.1 4'-phosphopantetheinyl transferase superfamily protein [Chryseosolibacter indicus]
MIRILSSTISASDKILPGDLSTCKVFPNIRQYDQDNKQILSLIGHLLCEKMFFDMQLPKTLLDTLHQNKFGKWQFSSSSIHFNISHSNNTVIAAVCDKGIVGIDIEWIRTIAISDFRSCYSDNEWTTIQQADNVPQIFFDLWTKKESLLKAWGMGLQIPLNNVIVEGFQGSAPAHNISGYFTSLHIPEYSCNLCTTFKANEVEIDEVEIEEILFK